jgi:nucleoid-associated protein YgaU
MTALWLDPAPRSTRQIRPAGAPDLQLLGSGHAPRIGELDIPGREGSHGLRLVEAPKRRTRRAPRRRTSVAVRRRRTLLAVTGLLLIGLALPLGGTGGHSHAAGSALAETGEPFVYTVQAGDTLWTIAQRIDPSGDPRPLVAKLAAQTGSDTVAPGQKIDLP